LEEQKGKRGLPETASQNPQSQQNPTEDWLKSAIDHIQSEKKDAALETGPTIDKLEFQTTINRDEYETSSLPTDPIIKRTRPRIVDVHPGKSRSSRFLYAITGLILGIALSLTGLLFLIHGVFGVKSGARSWVSDLLGLNPGVTNDFIPGIAMILLGILVIYITKEKTPPT
jgi:hypothetical protein